MPIDQLIFVGLNGKVAALHRDSGEIVWVNTEMRFGLVTLLLDGDRLIVSNSGYLYGLDPATGKTLWHNPMKGFGRGTPTALASVRGGQTTNALIQELMSDADEVAAVG